MRFCAEIAYESPAGGVHSDICWGHGQDSETVSDEHRALLHQCLDEWLNKSNGTGALWVGDAEYLKEIFSPRL